MKKMNKTTKTIFLAALMSLSLGACSTVSGMGKDLSSLFGTDKGKTTTEKIPAIGMSTNGQNWIDAQGKPIAPPTKKMDLSYDHLASKMDNGSVELYSLDAPGKPVATASNDDTADAASSYEGVPSSTDSSVTVYPFTDNMYTPGVKPGVDGYGRKPESAFNAPFNAKADGLLPVYNGAPTVVYFGNGSAAITPVAAKALARVVKSYHGGLLRVDGHASHHTIVKDPVRAALINFQISVKRAMAVTRRLLAKGVPPQAIRVGAFGDTEPAVPETSRAAQAKNRRVVIRGVQK